MESSKQYIPELRFPEYSGNWQEKKLGDIADKITQKNKSKK